MRLYLRYPLSYAHVTELIAKRDVEVDASCIWRWVKAYPPDLNKRCRPHLKPADRSYRIDETHIKVKGSDKYLYRALDSTGANDQISACRQTLSAQMPIAASGKAMPRVMNVDKNRHIRLRWRL